MVCRFLAKDATLCNFSFTLRIYQITFFTSGPCLFFFSAGSIFPGATLRVIMEREKTP